jgi:hypothetical protein
MSYNSTLTTLTIEGQLESDPAMLDQAMADFLFKSDPPLNEEQTVI